MNTVICTKDNILKFYASETLRQEALEKFSGKCVMNFAYTDYGGSFMDKVFIEFYKQEHPDKIVSENTSYNGQNAICEVTEEFDTYRDFYPDDLYTQMEQEMIVETANDFCKDHYCMELYNDVCEWLELNGHPLPNMYDYSESDCVKDCITKNETV